MCLGQKKGVLFVGCCCPVFWSGLPREDGRHHPRAIASHADTHHHTPSPTRHWQEELRHEAAGTARSPGQDAHALGYEDLAEMIYQRFAYDGSISDYACTVS